MANPMLSEPNIVYKATRNAIITLKLLPNSKTNESRKNIVDPPHAKYRCDRAMVVSIKHVEDDTELKSDKSFRDINFIYTTGEIVTAPMFDKDLDAVCGEGIHYFKTKEIALSWHYRMADKRHPDGIGTTWYENGQKEYKCIWKNGRRQGLEIEWYENGKKKYERMWKDGTEDGVTRWWYENGQREHVERWDGWIDGSEYRWE